MNHETVKIIERGEVVGMLQETKIHSWIKTHDGRTWAFKEVAGPGIENVLENGEFCVIYPGVIYERIQDCDQSDRPQAGN